MKLFVDDKRDFISGYECAGDYKSAVLLLSVMKFDFVTLDYNLGEEKTGLDILKYMHENKKYPGHINIHSDDSEGRQAMRMYAEKNFPSDVTITMNQL